MSRILTIAALGALLAPAGTPAVAEGTGAPPALSGDCNAEAAEFAVGQPYTESLGEEAREAAGAEQLRAIPPGVMVTMEFDPGRLQIELDEDNRVVRVSCG